MPDTSSHACLSVLPPGCALDLVLKAQTASAVALDSREIKRTADALVRFALSLGSPLLAPVSPMANRLVGAALLASDGALHATNDNSIPVGEDILLVEVVAVRATALQWYRDLMLRLGATSVTAVALDLLAEQPCDVQILPAPAELSESRRGNETGRHRQEGPDLVPVDGLVALVSRSWSP